MSAFRNFPAQSPKTQKMRFHFCKQEKKIMNFKNEKKKKKEKEEASRPHDSPPNLFECVRVEIHDRLSVEESLTRGQGNGRNLRSRVAVAAKPSAHSLFSGRSGFSSVLLVTVWTVPSPRSHSGQPGLRPDDPVGLWSGPPNSLSQSKRAQSI